MPALDIEGFYSIRHPAAEMDFNDSWYTPVWLRSLELRPRPGSRPQASQWTHPVERGCEPTWLRSADDAVIKGTVATSDRHP